MSDPLISARFRVQIEGCADAGVREVILPQARLLPGTRRPPAVEYGTLVLRRALTVSSDWYGWWDEGRRSKRKLGRAVLVTVLDPAGAALLDWRYRGARPSGYAVSGLDAMTGGVLVETLEISVEGFEATFAST